MNFVDVVQNRTSIRKFTAEAIDIQTLKEICRIGTLAPSVENFKPWRFTAITNKKILAEIANTIAAKIEQLPDTIHEASFHIKRQIEYFSTFFENAPAVILIFYEPSESVLEAGVGLSHDEANRMYSYPDMQSVGACAENMLLAAVNLGLGACWLSTPLIAKKEIELFFEANSGYELAALVAIGHPDEAPKAKPPIEIDTIFDFVS